eukprot:2962766-Pleurochrysis_carterae.AAC.2
MQYVAVPVGPKQGRYWSPAATANAALTSRNRLARVSCCHSVTEVFVMRIRWNWSQLVLGRSTDLGHMRIAWPVPRGRAITGSWQFISLSVQNGFTRHLKVVLRSLQVLQQAEHPSLRSIRTCLNFTLSLVGVQPIMRMARISFKNKMVSNLKWHDAERILYRFSVVAVGMITNVK